VEIKIKWIKRKQMTHENTYRDDNLKLKVPHAVFQTFFEEKYNFTFNSQFV
jgi:hypothetical protein